MHPRSRVCSLRKTGEAVCVGMLADHRPGVNGNKLVNERSNVQKCARREGAPLKKGKNKSLVFIFSVFSETLEVRERAAIEFSWGGRRGVRRRGEVSQSFSFYVFLNQANMVLKAVLNGFL